MSTPGIGCPIGMYYTRLTLLEGLMGGSKCTLGGGGGGGGGGVLVYHGTDGRV